MRLLLDTHTFLWFITDDARLSRTARELIEATHNERLLSMASIWEMAIKASLGRLAFMQPFEAFIPRQLTINQIDALPITIAHVATVADMPLHHRDPFDRLIIAQSMMEGLPLISVDPAFDAYPIERFW